MVTNTIMPGTTTRLCVLVVVMQSACGKVDLRTL